MAKCQRRNSGTLSVTIGRAVDRRGASEDYGVLIWAMMGFKMEGLWDKKAPSWFVMDVVRGCVKISCSSEV